MIRQRVSMRMILPKIALHFTRIRSWTIEESDRFEAEHQ
jgi:hypothetical protein